MRAARAVLGRTLLACALALAACGGGGGPGPDSGADAGIPAGEDGGGGDGGRDAGRPDASVDAGVPDASVDAGQPDGSVADAGSWRSSLSVCWTDAACPRVMAVAHGGAWDLAAAPYDSDAALAAAYAAGVDGVKIDVRVTRDDVPVISHSSPLELFESFDCYNQYIENMTAAQVTACHRAPSSTETFQRLGDVLAYLRGKMVVQLTVKRSVDYQRVIDELHARGAEDFAFLEVSTGELQTLVPTLNGSGSVYYLVNVASNLPEVDALLTLNNPRAFMYEFDPTVALGTLVSARLHPAGVRAFTYENSSLASAATLQAHYDRGLDVVSANQATAGVQARVQVNQARGVQPP